MSTPASGLRTCAGACHCGAVRYEVDLDLSAGTTRCNCTWCTKMGWWGTAVPPARFRLLTGEDQVAWIGTNPVGQRAACRTCGIMAFGHGDLPELGGEYYSINVRCLEGVDLEGVPVHYLDGRHDTWALLRRAPHADPFRAV